MKRFYVGLFLLAGVLSQVSNSRAGDIFFAAEVLQPPSSSGTFQIVFNTSPQNYTFMNGGIDLKLISSTPGVIEFTGGTVIDGGRWAATRVQDIAADEIGSVAGFSVLTPGLPSGTHVVFADINYNVIGAPGSTTTLSLQVNLDGLYDGTIPPLGADVSSSFSLSDALLQIVPEPTSLLLVVTGLALVCCRRR